MLSAVVHALAEAKPTVHFASVDDTPCRETEGHTIDVHRGATFDHVWAQLDAVVEAAQGPWSVHVSEITGSPSVRLCAGAVDDDCDAAISISVAEGKAVLSAVHRPGRCGGEVVDRLLDMTRERLKPLECCEWQAPGPKEYGPKEYGPRRPVPWLSVPELVDRWALTTPRAVAIVDGRGRLNYRELAERTNQLARYLLSMGVTAGDRVGVSLPRGTDAVVSFLGVLKAGAAYVPLDPAYPAARLAYVAEDADVALTVDADLWQAGRSAIARFSATPLDAQVSMTDVAYVMYTSGSTGKPKGAEIEHRAIVDLVWNADFARLDPHARMLQASSISFDMATLEIWGTLVRGGRLVVADAGPLTTRRLGELVREHGLTHVALTTALFHRVVDDDVESLTGVRVVIAGGEAMSAPHAEALLRVHAGARLVNIYGPTEATVCVCVHEMEGPEEVHGSVPIGKPNANTRIRLLDERGRPVPDGDVGEIYLGGVGLARGYHGRPDLTTQRFVRDPGTGARLYRTGDLARWSPDGFLEFAGRVDQQVKLHGHRIEPGEIEHVLRSHFAVGQAVVQRREDQPGHPHLAAYLTADAAHLADPPSAGELREYLGAQLPRYLVPTTYTWLDAFPVTVNGKIDVESFPVPRVDQHQVLTGARSTAESVRDEIGGIWSEIVQAQDIGPNDRLFDIGGGSLHVARIHATVVERFALADLRMADLFAYPTLRTYADHVFALVAAGRGGQR